VHFSQETSIEVAEWLVPEIIRLVRPPQDQEPDGSGGSGTTVTTSTTTTTTTSRPPPEPARVLLAGDSLMRDSVPSIQAVFATSAAPAVEVVSEFREQAIRPRTDEDRADWEPWVEAWDPDIVVEYLGYWETLAANPGVPPVVDDGFAEAYRAEILEPWFDHLEGIDADVVVLAAAPTGRPTVDPSARIVIAAVDAEAARRPRVTVLHTADVLAPEGHTELLPDPRTGEIERVRRIDGLHLCPDGGELVADLLVAHLESAYPGRFFFDPDPAGTGWRAGDWRAALPIDLARECPAP
jgi:hypothetical protein